MKNWYEKYIVVAFDRVSNDEKFSVELIVIEIEIND